MIDPDAIVSEVLASQPHAQYVLVPAAPGAGKSGTAERLAIQALGVHGERVAVACNTNAQAEDLAQRIATGWPTQPVHWLTRTNLRPGPHMQQLEAATGLQHIATNGDVPSGPCLVVATAARLSWLPPHIRFDLGIVDEAYQLPDFGFIQFSGAFDRAVLVGDPGQIDPIVRVEDERWRCDPSGPQRSAPDALVARHPAAVHRIPMPVTRRLLPDTVRYVQPAFYPDLPFESIVDPASRGLTLGVAGLRSVDRALDRLAAGQTLVSYELPAKVTGEHDPELADTIVEMVISLLSRGATVRRGGRPSAPLAGSDVGVLCAHRSQVARVAEGLAQHPEVLVETADRFQGLERDVMVVWHPLSGRADASAFHLDAGRACVATSRHRLGCVLVTRAGIVEALDQHVLEHSRALGMDDDTEWTGHQAQQQLLARLDADGRTLRAA